VYVLLGLPRVHGTVVRARPGVSGDVLKRLREHLAENPWFLRALIARDRQIWESNHVRYLEGRLHHLCRDNPLIDRDGRMDSDETLHPHTTASLERQSLPGIIGAVIFAGVPLQPNWQ